MCAVAGTSVSSRFSANSSTHSRRSRNSFPDAPKTVCCSLVVASAVERTTDKAWRRRCEGETKAAAQDYSEKVRARQPTGGATDKKLSRWHKLEERPISAPRLPVGGYELWQRQVFPRTAEHLSTTCRLASQHHPASSSSCSREFSVPGVVEHKEAWPLLDRLTEGHSFSSELKTTRPLAREPDNPKSPLSGDQQPSKPVLSLIGDSPRLLTGCCEKAMGSGGGARAVRVDDYVLFMRATLSVLCNG